MDIPCIDIGPLFGGPSTARDAVDAKVMYAAGSSGFMTVTGLPDDVLAPPVRYRLLRLFELSETEKRSLSRKSFYPECRNIYRGWFPVQNGFESYKEGIDLGPDLAYPDRVPDPTDPLTEASAIPQDTEWQALAARYYLTMEHVAAALMRCLARGLDLDEHFFSSAFQNGISTLRLIRYPVRSEQSFGSSGENLWVDDRGTRRYLLGTPHGDSGFLTLLAQNAVPGLQAQNTTGDWIDVPPQEGTLAVNFGRLLERWTGGKIKATVHRVVGDGAERFSIPFFYEPAVDAVIAPIDGLGQPFEPVSYGDHLWEVTTGFVEQQGIAHLRKPRGVSQ